MPHQRHAERPRHKERRDPDWSQGLPGAWHAAAIAPISFATQREYEMPASRTLGYDEQRQPCFYRHSYILGALHSDDDEEYYETVVYGEEVRAWRLRDERWLIWRIAHAEGRCRDNQGFFSFSERMPQ